MPEFKMEYAIKAQQWELTKGHLRALVAIQGSYSSSESYSDVSTKGRWMTLDKMVEDFIKKVSDEGLAE